MAVLSVTEDQVQDAAGDLQDMYIITFTAPPSTGKFVVAVPQAGDAIAAARAAIDTKTAEVVGILGI